MWAVHPSTRCLVVRIVTGRFAEWQTTEYRFWKQVLEPHGWNFVAFDDIPTPQRDSSESIAEVRRLEEQRGTR